MSLLLNVHKNDQHNQYNRNPSESQAKTLNPIKLVDINNAIYYFYIMASLLGVSQKCQYALRALFELALRYPSQSVTTVSEIAQAQNIPLRFLEQILSKIKTGGYIESRRGKQGGYVMAVAPSSISVGEIIRLMEGPEEVIDCLKKPEDTHCKVTKTCVFRDLWQSARSAMADIFDTTTFQDLVEKHKKYENQIDYFI